MPGVRNFGSHIGRAEVADEVVGPNFTELWISLDPKVGLRLRRWPRCRSRRRLPGPVPRPAHLPARAHQGGAHRRERLDRGAHLRPDLEVLREQAERSRRRPSQDMPGRGRSEGRAAGAGAADRGGLRPEAAAALRAAPRRRARAATTPSCKGSKVGEIYRGPEDLRRGRVGRARSSRRDLTHAARAADRHAAPAAHVPLGEVADVRVAPAPNEIKRESASRRIDVTANVRGRDLGSVAREIEARGAQAGVPARLPSRVAGRIRRAARSRTRLLLLGLLALAGHLPDPAARTSDRPRMALLVFATLPFALVGGVVARAADRRRRCRSARWSASSPCSASPRATASCWSATIGTSSARRACPSAASWCCAAPRSASRPS